MHLPWIDFFREVLAHQCLKAQFFEGNIANRETCNKHWLVNFQHDFRTSGEIFLDLNLMIYAVGVCVKCVFLNTCRMLGSPDARRMV